MARCPVCASAVLEPFLDLGDVPVFCNVQWPSVDEALRAKRAPLALSACPACGHVCNASYDPDLLAYAPGYDNTQHFSSTFRDYARRLVRRLVDAYDIRGRTVVDIGCGRGDLLQMLCAEGGNRGFGFDPSFAGAGAEGPADVTISRELFTPERGAELAPGLVCCRHVLEHVAAPDDFLVSLRAAVSGRGAPVVYLEVPNGEQLLRESALWDYIYEHVSYFSRRSLALSLEKAGFEILALYEDFGGQFLCADMRPRPGAAPGPGTAADPGGYSAALEAAARHMSEKLRHWRRWTRSLASDGRAAAVWGAGSKGVMFLNLTGAKSPKPIEFAVDQNPNKHGQYIAGTGQQVAPPERIVASGVEEVVVMNQIYFQEITNQLSLLGSRARVLTA